MTGQPNDGDGTGYERDMTEVEDVFDRAAESEGALSDMRNMNYGPEENYAVKAAYFRGIVRTLQWLQGETETDELLSQSQVDSLLPSEEGES